MKAFTSIYSIKLNAWITIQQSYTDGKPDLRYIIDGKVPKKISKKDSIFLYDSYLKLLYQLPEMDLNLINSWSLYVCDFEEFKVNCEMNDTCKMYGKELQPVDTNNLNKSFNTYLDSIQEGYKDFEKTVFFIRPNYKELWTYDIDIPDKLIENEDFDFFIFEEYFNFIKSFPLKYQILLSQKEFVLKFIDTKTLKFSDLKAIDAHLYRLFRDEIKDMDKYRAIRTDFFNLNKLQFIPNNNNSLLSEVIILRDVTNQEIDTEKISLGEYYEIKNYAKQKTEPKKPQASG